ncbi:SRPBCC family protein [Streptomyces sp. NPDC001594]|uniref:SRPBCC family protein n=1 Tax=Streptomyces sp. NPDC001594 TaxID=3364590 RepID=UPI0036D05472
MAKLEPQDLSFAESAPFRADASITCPTSARAVFDVLKDHRRWVDWVGTGVTSVEPTSTPEEGVGSTRTLTFLHVAKVEERFIAWEEPTLWAFTGTSFRPGILSKLVDRFQIEPLDGENCRITYRMGADFPPLLRPFARILIRQFARAANTALKRVRSEAIRRQSQ